jgi:uncharacterized surface protein with fasciclin (FAS1) repeats
MIYEYTAGRPPREAAQRRPRPTAARVAVAGLVAMLTLAGCARIPRAASSATTPEPPSPTTLLAQAGYVGVPFRWERHYPVIDATIGTARATLILDSGFGGELELIIPSGGQWSSVHVTDIRGTMGTAAGSEPGTWALADQVRVGSLALGSMEAYVRAATEELGALGAVTLSGRGAIVDYATDTLYLLDDKVPSVPSAVPSVATTRSLRATLEAAGQYRTFLALMRDAGLLPLLEDSTRNDATVDSLAWRAFRLRAIQRAGAAALPPTRERTLSTRRGIDRLLRQAGRQTVFAPTDAAFARLPPAVLRALRLDTAQLRGVLRAHFLQSTYLDTAALRTLVRGLARPPSPTMDFHVLGNRIDIDRLVDGENGTVLARATIVQPDLVGGSDIAHGIDRVLVPQEIATPFATALADGGYIAIRMSRLANGMYVVRAAVDSAPVTLLVDTGSPSPLTLDSTRVQDRRQPRERSISFASAPGMTVSAGAALADLGQVNQALEAQDIPPIDGILGSELLTRYAARVDCATGTLYLQRSALPPR